MKNSVARRLVGGANVGSMLSGGMDSSSIVALAREIRLATGTSSDTGVIPLPTISFAFDDDCESTDSKHSRELAAMNGLRAERIGAGDIADDRVAQLFCTAPTSPFDAFMHLAAFVYRRAQLCGLSTVLDGIDGDLVFGIHAPYVPGLIRSGRLITFAKEVYRSNQRKSGSLATFGRNMVSNSLNALPQRLHVWRRGRMVRDASQLCADSIVRREFAVQHGVVERMAQLRQFTAVTDDFRQNHVAWMEHPFATVGMERYERLATSFGIRPQHPLYDVQLLEYCVNLPWNLRTRNGWSKYGMRKAMSQSLSNATCWRCEYDNLYPRVAIRFLNLHRELLEDFVQSGLHQHDCILDVGRIRQSMSDFAGGNSRAGMDVWQAFYLSKWLESA